MRSWGRAARRVVPVVLLAWLFAVIFGVVAEGLIGGPANGPGPVEMAIVVPLAIVSAVLVWRYRHRFRSRYRSLDEFGIVHPIRVGAFAAGISFVVGAMQVRAHGDGASVLGGGLRMAAMVTGIYAVSTAWRSRPVRR